MMFEQIVVHLFSYIDIGKKLVIIYVIASNDCLTGGTANSGWWLAVMYAITSTYACRQVKNKKMRDRDGEARKSFSELLTEWKERTLMNKDDKKKG